SFPRLFVFAEAHAENYQRLSLELFSNFLNMGQGFATRAAPCGPKIKQDNSALKIVHRNSVAINGGHGEGGSHVGSSQLNTANEAKSSLVIGIFFWINFNKLLETSYCGVVLTKLGKRFAIEKQSVGEVCV